MNRIHSTATFCSKALNSQYVSAHVNMTLSTLDTSNFIGKSQLASNCVGNPYVL